MKGFSQTDIFTRAIGLAEPWRVSNLEMLLSEKDPERMEVHITVDYLEGSKFPQCGESRALYMTRQNVLSVPGTTSTLQK